MHGLLRAEYVCRRVEPENMLTLRFGLSFECRLGPLEVEKNGGEVVRLFKLCRKFGPRLSETCQKGDQRSSVIANSLFSRHWLLSNLLAQSKQSMGLWAQVRRGNGMFEYPSTFGKAVNHLLRPVQGACKFRCPLSTDSSCFSLAQ